MVYYGFVFWFFVGGLRGVPASVAGSFLPLIPVFGLAAGYLLGDRLRDRQ
jgi:drug/metabolite transporter (DMT)-like permease